MERLPRLLFELLEPRRFLAVVVTDLDPSLLTLPTSEWYTAKLDVVPGYADAADGLTSMGTYIRAGHKEALAARVARIIDTSGGTASDYAVTVSVKSFAASTSSASQVIPAAMLVQSDSGFEVVLTGDVARAGLVAGWHTFSVDITDLRDPTRSTRTESIAFVAAPAIAGTTRPFTAISGQRYEDELAIFTGVDTSMLDRYTVSSDLSGALSDGYRIEVIGESTVRVVGNVTFVTPGKFDTTVSLRFNSGDAPSWIESGGLYWGRGGWGGGLRGFLDHYSPHATGGSTDARGRVNVEPGLVAVDPERRNSVVVDRGSRFNGVIASFDILGDIDLANCRVEVDFTGLNADGTSTTRRLNASLARAADGSLDVVVNDHFVQNGSMTARLLLGSQQIGLTTSSAGVRDTFRVEPTRIDFREGREWTGVVGRLVGSDRPDYDEHYEVTISWHDNTTSPGTLVAREDGSWDIVASHTYEVLGYDRSTYVHIHVEQTLTPHSQALPQGEAVKRTFSFYDRDAGSSTISAAEHDGFAVVGSYDRHEPSLVAALWLGRSGEVEGYSAQITWDDGSVESIPLPSTHVGKTVEIYSTQTFATGVHHTGQLQITRTSPAGEPSTKVTSVSVEASYNRVNNPPVVEQEIPLFARIEWVSRTEIEGSEASGVWARLVPTDPSFQPDDIEISLGVDERSVPVTVSVGADGVWSISATVKVKDFDGRAKSSYRPYLMLRAVAADGRSSRESTEWAVSISNDPSRVEPVAKHGSFRQLEEFTTTLGSFYSSDPTLDVDDFTAVIDWGDGTVESGVISRRYKGGFDVAGTHTYRTDGQHTPTITLVGAGASVSFDASLRLDHHPVDVRNAPISPVGYRVNAAVATYDDLDLVEGIDVTKLRIDHAALIDWGDGTITTGALVQTAPGRFEVVGDHTYAAAGDYVVKTLVRQNTSHLPQVSARLSFDWDHEFGRMVTSGDALTAAASADTSGDFAVQQLIRITGEDPMSSPRDEFVGTLSASPGGFAPISRLFSLMSIASDDSVMDDEEGDLVQVLAG